MVCATRAPWAQRAAALEQVAGEFAALVHGHVVRPYSHSLSDDERLYKTPDERDAEAKRDPVRKMARALVKDGVTDENRSKVVSTIRKHAQVIESLREKVA